MTKKAAAIALATQIGKTAAVTAAAVITIKLVEKVMEKTDKS